MSIGKDLILSAITKGSKSKYINQCFFEYNKNPERQFIGYQLVLYPKKNEKHKLLLDALRFYSDPEPSRLVPCVLPYDDLRFLEMEHNFDIDFDSVDENHVHVYIQCRHRDKKHGMIGASRTWSAFLTKFHQFDLNAFTCLPSITGWQEWVKYVCHELQPDKTTYDIDDLSGSLEFCDSAVSFYTRLKENNDLGLFIDVCSTLVRSYSDDHLINIIQFEEDLRDQGISDSMILNRESHIKTVINDHNRIIYKKIDYNNKVALLHEQSNIIQKVTIVDNI